MLLAALSKQRAQVANGTVWSARRASRPIGPFNASKKQPPDASSRSAALRGRRTWMRLPNALVLPARHAGGDGQQRSSCSDRSVALGRVELGRGSPAAGQPVAGTGGGIPNVGQKQIVLRSAFNVGPQRRKRFLVSTTEWGVHFRSEWTPHSAVETNFCGPTSIDFIRQGGSA